MTFLELRKRIKANIFTYLDVVKLFPEDNPELVKTQLNRFSTKKLIIGIKRGLYCFEPETVDEFELASRLYQPSYISLETALNYYGIIPDVPQAITSITLTTTKNLTNAFGNFYYTKIKPVLYFGFSKLKSTDSEGYFNLAKKEKALLDYFYIRKIKRLDSLRLNLKEINLAQYRRYRTIFPKWLPQL